ncbi:MAG: GerMN domain-containing protein [Candidatus Acidiferrales bacterium]
MPRNLKITLAILAVAVVIGLISLRGLHERIQNLSEAQSSEEEARRDLLKPTVSTPTDVLVQARMFWASGPGTLTPITVELPLSADPVQRGRQVLDALIANVPSDGERTLPADATVLGFYILPDGTAIADFSDALASETPSGILSEEMAVNSIARTLENNVPILRRLKILIHGQEAETLAGHVDLTGFFDLNPPGAAAPAPSSSSAPQETPSPQPAAAPTKPSR